MPRRAIAFLLPLLLLTACRFSVTRSLNPGEIRGTLVFQTPSGITPAKGAQVVLQNSTVVVQADNNGRFILPNLDAGTYALSITASSTGSGTADSGLLLQNIVMQPTSAGALADGRDLGQIVIGAFGQITGSVTLNSASVGSGATAVLLGIAQLDVNGGSYTFQSVLPGDYTLSVFAVIEQGTTVVAGPAAVHVGFGTTVTVPAFELSSATPVSSGQVQGLATLSGAGATNQGIGISLYSPDVDSTLLPSVETSDDAGDYSAVEIPAGVYTVTASVGGFEAVSVPAIIVGSGTTSVPTITLTAFSAATLNPDVDIAAACQNFSQCNALGTQFTSESNCEQVLDNMVTQLGATPVCSEAIQPFVVVADCIAASSCDTLKTAGQHCPVPLSSFAVAVDTDPTCAAIASVLLGNQADGGLDGGSDGGSDGGVVSSDGGVDAGPEATWSVVHAEPAVREGAGLVYDSKGDRILAFGGSNGIFIPDAGLSTSPVSDGNIWTWSVGGASGWGQLTGTGAPLAFDWGGDVLFDADNDRVVVFTSSTTGTATPANVVELVTFDSAGAATWAPTTTSGTAPALRFGATFAYDPVHQQAYLFGGVSESGQYLNDLWSLSLPSSGPLAWQQLGGASPPVAREFTASAVSPRDGTLYLIGGDNNTGALQDVYSYSGSTWTPLTNAAVPDGSFEAQAAYYEGATATADTILLFGVANVDANREATWTLNVGVGAASATWTEVTSTTGYPGARSEPTFCAVPGAAGTATFYAFGGQEESQSRSLLNELWSLTTTDSGTTWSWGQLSQSHDTWSGASAVAEPSTGDVYLWGGVNASSGDLQTIFYQSIPSSTSAWVPTSQPDTTPSPRTGAATVFDSVNGRMVIFGGDLGLNDTWTINPSELPPTWVELNDGESGAPSPTRSITSVAYDAKNLQVVLFGGALDLGQGPGSQPTLLQDTWALNIPDGATTATWTLLSTAQAPPVRAGAAAAFDATNSRFIIIGGYGSGGTLTDVWSLALAGGDSTASWSQLETTPSDPTHPFDGVVQGSAYYDGPNSRILLFGGGVGALGAQITSFSSQLWSLDLSRTPAVWTALCPAGALAPVGRSSPVLLGLPSGLYLYGGTMNAGLSNNGLDNDQYLLPFENIPVCPPTSG
jgi:hypothetical protein